MMIYFTLNTLFYLQFIHLQFTIEYYSNTIHKNKRPCCNLRFPNFQQIYLSLFISILRDIILINKRIREGCGVFGFLLSPHDQKSNNN
jgi:hypothetical protein